MGGDDSAQQASKIGTFSATAALTGARSQPKAGATNDGGAAVGLHILSMQTGEGTLNFKHVLLALGAVSAWTPVHAYEAVASRTPPGALFGASADVPPPGIYSFTSFYTYQGNYTGPIANVIGTNTKFQSATAAQGFLFVPGWTILGATYDAVLVQPFTMQSSDSPLEMQAAGVANTFISPVELSWKLGDSGFAVKAGFGFFPPNGTVSGPAGTGNVGTPYWTFQPELIVSYLKDGWNLSAAIYEEFSTRSTVSNYTTGNILHADFTATKTFDKWTIGPVAYYIGQVSDDKSSAYYNYLVQNANRYDSWAVGGLVTYDFGPAAVTLWGAQEVYATASGATNGGPIDRSTTSKGFSIQASLSYRIWAPDSPEPSPLRARYRK